jgi:DNA-binding response OmpR family regulator
MRKTRNEILCIEDDRETAELISEELADRGYRVDVFHDGRGALATIFERAPDLVLCDIAMPLFSGFDLLERLTAVAPRFRNMPFVFLTAFTERDIELKARLAGADDFVTKPIDFDLLDAVIAARLAGIVRPNSDGAVGDKSRTKVGARTWVEALKAANGGVIWP